MILMFSISYSQIEGIHVLMGSERIEKMRREKWEANN